MAPFTVRFGEPKAAPPTKGSLVQTWYDAFEWRKKKKKNQNKNLKQASAVTYRNRPRRKMSPVSSLGKVVDWLPQSTASERASAACGAIQLAESERRANLLLNVNLLPRRGSLTLYTLDFWNVFSNDFLSCWNTGATNHQECCGFVWCHTALLVKCCCCCLFVCFTLFEKHDEAKN